MIEVMFVVTFVFMLCLIAVIVVFYRRLEELTRKLEELGTQVETSLDVLDKCYASLSETASTPVLYDDPIVRQLLNEVNNARDAILNIANNLVSFDDEDD